MTCISGLISFFTGWRCCRWLWSLSLAVLGSLPYERRGSEAKAFINSIIRAYGAEEALWQSQIWKNRGKWYGARLPSPTLTHLRSSEDSSAWRVEGEKVGREVSRTEVPMCPKERGRGSAHHKSMLSIWPVCLRCWVSTVRSRQSPSLCAQCYETENKHGNKWIRKLQVLLSATKTPTDLWAWRTPILESSSPALSAKWVF